MRFKGCWIEVGDSVIIKRTEFDETELSPESGFTVSVESDRTHFGTIDLEKALDFLAGKLNGKNISD
jgi:hypothetical protein